MPHPYQCLFQVKTSSGVEFLLAACGPKLLSISTKDASIASQWSSGSAGIVEVEKDTAAEADNGERPAKKQKTAEKAPSTLSNIIRLAASPDQRHVISVTEDKCIRVFDFDTNGVLTELSQRIMPKRPCGIQVLPDNETIIVADKFGDVYSLPLLPVDAPQKNPEAGATEEKKPEPEKPAFKPSATNLTVHSQRNLKALEAQQKQKLFAPRKEALAFEHKLLLGHVSMLTDVAFATREVEGKQRGYIITADRDEHIRVSRGPPQAHVIEGYCLAHKEFISKLCLIPGTDLLVSGGGDSWLGIWDWPSFALKQTINLEPMISKMLSKDDPAKPAKIAVSGIWAIPLSRRTGSHALIVACEQVPALCIFDSSFFVAGGQEGRLLELGAAPIDVAYLNGHLVASLDVRGDDKPRLLGYTVKSDDAGTISLMTKTSDSAQTSLDRLNNLTGVEEDPKAIDNLVYGIENLRKRTGPGEDEPEQE